MTPLKAAAGACNEACVAVLLALPTVDVSSVPEGFGSGKVPSMILVEVR
jgi:hypothetical protein